MISTKQYAETLLYAVSEVSPDDYDTVIDRLVHILKQEDKLALLPEIIAEFEQLSQEQGMRPEVSVTVANPEDANLALKAINVAIKKDAEITTKVNSEIIGGVILRVDDTLIDNSLRTKLESLRNNLIA